MSAIRQVYSLVKSENFTRCTSQGFVRHAPSGNYSAMAKSPAYSLDPWNKPSNFRSEALPSTDLIRMSKIDVQKSSKIMYDGRECVHIFPTVGFLCGSAVWSPVVPRRACQRGDGTRFVAYQLFHSCQAPAVFRHWRDPTIYPLVNCYMAMENHHV